MVGVHPTTVKLRQCSSRLIVCSLGLAPLCESSALRLARGSHTRAASAHQSLALCPQQQHTACTRQQNKRQPAAREAHTLARHPATPCWSPTAPCVQQPHTRNAQPTPTPKKKGRGKQLMQLRLSMRPHATRSCAPQDIHAALSTAQARHSEYTGTSATHTAAPATPVAATPSAAAAVTRPDPAPPPLHTSSAHRG